MNLTFDSMPPVLNATQLSEDFPTLQIGKRMLVPRDSLLIWIKQNTGGGAA